MTRAAKYQHLACAIVLVANSGCVSSGLFENARPQKVTAALPSPEQIRKEVQTLVPLGTPRQEVLRRIDSAGIKGHFGARETPGGGHSDRHDVYYGEFWKRPDGQLWHVSVEFWFDGSGKLERLEFPGYAKPDAAIPAGKK